MTWLFLSEVFLLLCYLDICLLFLCYLDICLLLFSLLTCLALCNAMDCSKSSFPVLCYLPESAQTHVYWVDDAISSFLSYHRGTVPKSETKEVSNTLVKEWVRDFPGGPVIKTLPSNSGDASLIPGWGTKIPHATGHQSPCGAMKSWHSQ